MKSPWWVQEVHGNVHWTTEELTAHTRGWGVTIVCFLIVYFPTVLLEGPLGINPHAGALVGGAVSVIAALYLASRYCSWMWPELFRKAEADAGRRESLSDPEDRKT
jgi:hypothetical protein